MQNSPVNPAMNPEGSQGTGVQFATCPLCFLRVDVIGGHLLVAHLFPQGVGDYCKGSWTSVQSGVGK